MSFEKKTIKINGLEVKPGNKGDVSLNWYQLPTKSVVEIPIYIFRSNKPGPTLLIQAGMHGDETNGIEIVRRLIIKEEVRNPLCGSIIAIPVINTFAFLYGTRDLPDGKDLNRCFPGSKNGSLGSRIAYDLMHEIIPQIDFGLDFHTGGGQINNYPQLRCTFEDKASLALAKQFAPEYILNSGFREGSYRKEASKHGKPILVFEGGESQRFNNSYINDAVKGALRLMNHLKMTNVKVPESKSVLINKTSWVRAKASGIFHRSKTNGVPIEKGETIGMITDPFGEHEEKIIAPQNGYIIAINNQPVINQGDALINVGME